MMTKNEFNIVVEHEEYEVKAWSSLTVTELFKLLKSLGLRKGVNMTMLTYHDKYFEHNDNYPMDYLRLRINKTSNHFIKHNFQVCITEKSDTVVNNDGSKVCKERELFKEFENELFEYHGYVKGVEDIFEFMKCDFKRESMFTKIDFKYKGRSVSIKVFWIHKDKHTHEQKVLIECEGKYPHNVIKELDPNYKLEFRNWLQILEDIDKQYTINELLE